MTSRAAHFQTIVVDPPWPYPEGFNGWGSRRPIPYPAMSIDEIASLPIRDVLAREGYVFLWTTNRWLGNAFGVLQTWGLAYRQTLTWCKPDVGGLGGMFGTNIEFVLVAQNIRPGTNAHGKRTQGKRVSTSWFTWPKGAHSEKPGDFYALVEQVSPGPYADVFARRVRPGWCCIGNEIDGRDVREALLTATSDIAPTRSP